MNTLSSNIFSYIVRIGLFLLVFLIPLISSAKCGGVDYSQGADALEDATEFLGTTTMYVIEICNAIAAIVVVVSALQIYVKMNYQEGEITKHIMLLMGGILFMIGATLVMPAFFGYQVLSFAY